MGFSAVGQVHSSATDVVHDTSAVRASEQHSDRSWYSWHGHIGPRRISHAPEPLEHSVLDSTTWMVDPWRGYPFRNR